MWCRIMKYLHASVLIWWFSVIIYCTVFLKLHTILCSSLATLFLSHCPPQEAKCLSGRKRATDYSRLSLTSYFAEWKSITGSGTNYCIHHCLKKKETPRQWRCNRNGLRAFRISLVRSQLSLTVSLWEREKTPNYSNE